MELVFERGVQETRTERYALKLDKKFLKGFVKCYGLQDLGLTLEDIKKVWNDEDSRFDGGTEAWLKDEIEDYLIEEGTETDHGEGWESFDNNGYIEEDGVRI